jgi:chromosomal replication initiator protein
MTCDQMPNAIPALEERLKSRLQWGLIADIKPPCFETRAAIVERKAIEDGIELPTDVAMFLARHIERNVRELEGALMRLEAHAQLLKAPISLTMAKDVLGDMITYDSHQVSAADIIRVVCQAFEVSPADLKGPRRHRHVTTPRQVAMFLIRELTSASLPHIGTQFGGRDHTTVLNAIKRITEVQKVNPLLRQRLQAIRTQLGA